jgi:2-methylcitrate dehydratase PrpD
VPALRFGDLGEEVLRLSRRCILDGLAVMLAGSEQPGMTPLESFVRRQGGAPDSRLVGHAALRLPVRLAALWNGTAGHAMDWDDTQLAEGPGRPYGLLMHPTIPPLAAALALSDLVAAEAGSPVNGRDFLVAFNAGFEVACKIAEAINPDHYMRGFHTSGTIGTFGAAATAAKLLGLDQGQTATALGIAASMASGIRANFGTMTKPLHVGRAAENGRHRCPARPRRILGQRRGAGRQVGLPRHRRPGRRAGVGARSLRPALHDGKAWHLDQALSIGRPDPPGDGCHPLPDARERAEA